MILHQLIEDDPDRRIEFSRVLTEGLRQNSNHVWSISSSNKYILFEMEMSIGEM